MEDRQKQTPEDRSQETKGKQNNGKIMAVDSTVATTGFYFPTFYPFVSDKDATYPLPADPSWIQQPVHADTGAPLGPTPTRARYRDTKNPGCRGFGLAQAIWAVERGGFDVILLTKTNINM